MSSCERSKKWREKLKSQPENSDRYKQYKELKALRSKINRRKVIDDETKAERNLATSRRMREYRARKKIEAQSVSDIPPSENSKRSTRSDDTKVEKQRQYWKLKQSESRARISAQKKRRITEKRKEKYRQKRIVSLQGEDKDDDGEPGSYQTSVAKRKAISRAKTSIPKTASKFAAVNLLKAL